MSSSIPRPLAPVSDLRGRALADFWLGNGPLGKGATFGKAVLNLHVVDQAMAEPPRLAPAFRRAFLQVPILIPVTGDLLIELLGVRAQAGFFLHHIFSVAAATILFSHIYCVRPTRSAAVGTTSGLVPVVTEPPDARGVLPRARRGGA